MGDLERIEAKLDWCVSALKHLLLAEVGEESEWEATPLDEVDREPVPDFIVPDHSAKAPTLSVVRACTHNQQVLIDGKVTCARCGTVLAASGIVGRDPGAPKAGEQTKEASDRNPGTPMVPYHVG